jgi:hypothetical protein
MIATLRSITPWVWLRPGERLRVQLMYIARSPVKSGFSVTDVMGSLLGHVGACAVAHAPSVGRRGPRRIGR